jgi:glycosyltransferase involved in cell wall biosynthesis
MQPSSKGQSLRWCFFSPGRRSIDVLAGDSRSSGGAEAQTAYLAAAMAELGHEASLIYGDGSQHRPPTELASVTCIDAAPCWRKPSSITAFWRALRGAAPDVIYARLPSDFLALQGLLGRFGGRARFVYALAHDDHCRPWEAYSYRRWLHAPLYALGLHSADAILVQHEGQRARLARRLQGRAVHVPNLVRSFAPVPRPFESASIDAIWVAQIRPEKRLERFLDLAASSPELRCSVVGGFDPTLPAASRAELDRRMRLSSNVTYWGPQPADVVMSLIARSKVLVNTSSGEGFPNSMLEAWSLGVPVVSLSVDPGRIIEEQRIGLLSRTDPGLRNDVRLLTRGEGPNCRMGARALAYVRSRHSLKAVCAALSLAISGSPVTAVADRVEQSREALS